MERHCRFCKATEDLQPISDDVIPAEFVCPIHMAVILGNREVQQRFGPLRTKVTTS